MGKRLGVLIGTNHYQDSAFRPLQYAEVDTRAFAQWLANPRGGNWSDSDLHVLLGMQATKESVEALLTQVCLRVAEPGDVLLLYFAGHAFIDESSGEGFLACANTLYHQPSSGLHLLSLVRDVLVRSAASQIIVALDCFQTGSVWNMRRVTPYDFQPLLGQTLTLGLQQVQGRLLYCSCRGSDIAPETGEQHLGRLMYRMIVGLSGPALDGAAQQATLQRLHAYLLNTLDAQHQPQIFGQESRPIVLVGELPQLVPAASLAHNTSRSYTTGALAAQSSPAGQVTFQGIVEDDMLAEPAMQQSRSAQLSGSLSRPISISMVEENLQLQCAKLMQQARQLLMMQNLPAALNVIDQVLQMVPTHNEALTTKGQILGATGRFQEAMLVVEQLLTIEPNNALAWSMRAALLTNLGRTQEALAAVERSLVLDPNNPETLAMRSTIQANAASQSFSASNMRAISGRAPVRDSAGSFLLSAGLQLLALIAGGIGASIPILQPHLPILIGFVLESLGLATLCVLAARGSYRYGFGRFFFSLALCLAAVGILGGLYKFGYTWLIGKVVAFPPLIVPVLFLGFWLIAAAALPFLAGLGGLVFGLILGVRRKA